MAPQIKILFTGKGTAGSWQCRGVQMGSLIGAVRPQAPLSLCKDSDVIVVVKRINHPFFEAVKQSGTPWVWDLVDFFPQPLAGTWRATQAIRWVRREIKQAAPAGVIYPNQRMADDIGIPGEVIYHHARQAPANPVRDKVQRIGYEGSPKFLGKWRKAIQAECAARGWYFAEGAPLHTVDIVLALRDGDHNGYVQQHWKSNIKLANAHGTGTPFIGAPEAGYQETATGHERWVQTPAQLRAAFDELAPVETRRVIHRTYKAHAITVESRAQQLRQYLARVLANA